MTAPQTLTVAVKADASHAITQLQKVKALLAEVGGGVKPGYRTTEFWATAVAPIVLALLTFVFHRDFSGYVQAAALAAAGVSTAAYAIGRAHLKRPTTVANLLYDAHHLAPIVGEAVDTAGQVEQAAP